MKFHYVYRITNTELNKHYYGCRSSNVEPVTDLGKTYFSSSTDKQFILDQRENPKRYKYKVVRTFNSRKTAELFETMLHEKFQVQVHRSFYNKAINTRMGFSVVGVPKTQEHKDKIRQFAKGKTYEELYGVDAANEKKTKLKKGMEKRGKKWKNNIRTAKTGVKLSKLHKTAISNGLVQRYKDESFYKSFCETMRDVNKRTEKRKAASEKITAKWKDPVYLEKMKKRAHKPKKIIKITFRDRTDETFTGFDDMIKHYNFNATLVRKFINTGKPCYPKRNTNSEKTKNTLGVMFEEINENKKN